MTNIIIEDIEAIANKVESAFKPAIKVAENDAHAIVHSAVSYIETNGLQDAYQIALTVVGAMAPGASWTVALAAIEAQVVAAGKALISGASAIVASQAQADLIAAGKLLPPVSAAVAS